MPIGSYANLYYIAKELEHKNPDYVLDLGIGLGMNGVLIRQYVDLIHNKYTDIVGVEIWNKYRNPLWQLYDYIHEMDILSYIGEANSERFGGLFDFILMTDVIEHFYKYIAKEILTVLPSLLKPNGVILISTPGVFVPQGVVNGNALETHLSFWPPEDFPPGYTAIKQGKDHHGDETTIMKYVKS